MVEQELIKDINDELTFSGALPFSLSDKEIGRILKIAREFFYDNWRHAVEPKYLVLPLDLFKSDLFKIGMKCPSLMKRWQELITSNADA